jgi:hypothetical protein
VKYDTDTVEDRAPHIWTEHRVVQQRKYIPSN